MIEYNKNLEKMIGKLYEKEEGYLPATAGALEIENEPWITLSIEHENLSKYVFVQIVLRVMYNEIIPKRPGKNRSTKENQDHLREMYDNFYDALILRGMDEEADDLDHFIGNSIKDAPKIITEKSRDDILKDEIFTTLVVDHQLNEEDAALISEGIITI